MSERKFQSSYVLSRTLGKGNFSLVRKCRHKFSRSMYAAKLVKLPKQTVSDNEEGVEDYEDILDMVRNEVGIMRILKHTNIIQFVDVFYTTEQVIVITELTELGDLHEFLLKEPVIDEDMARLFCLQIASAVNYMHSLKIVHRDIKPENVLLFSNTKTDTTYTLKLCDFGLAEEITTICGLARVCGSPSFVAPEIIEFKSYGLKVDVWSMGILFYLILCKYVPFEDVDMSSKFQMIMNAEVEFNSPDWDCISTGAKGLIRNMLEKNPKKRFKASDVFYSRWFRQSESKRIKKHSIKNAALVITSIKAFARNRKLLRDDAVISRRLIENTFLFSKTSKENRLTIPIQETLLKVRSNSELITSTSSSSPNNNNKLPPIINTTNNNSIIRASSEESIKLHLRSILGSR